MAENTSAGRTAHPPTSSALAAYITMVTIAAATLLIATSQSFPRGHWVDLAIFLAAAVTSEHWAVASSLEGATSTIVDGRLCGGRTLDGPAFACFVCGWRRGHQRPRHSHRHWTRVLLQRRPARLSAGLAALTYRVDRRPRSDEPDVATPSPYWSRRSYFWLVNDTLVTIVVFTFSGRPVSAASGRPRFATWVRSYISMAPLVHYWPTPTKGSRWNILYFPFLISVIYKGFELYANMQAETDHALVAARRHGRQARRVHLLGTRSVSPTMHREIARRPSICCELRSSCRSAARVHDLGKIATADRILFKPPP